ncbi:hypothetical protein M0805_000547 [Coniferiporia weirii]|nr:hypothetical protein M0805_000547 [Coniferiporia weirii]
MQYKGTVFVEDAQTTRATVPNSQLVVHREMIASTVAQFALLLIYLFGTAKAQTFSLDCASYPDVCDTYSNVVLCHGFTGNTLHYDATSSNSGLGQKRRNAIGCGANNYCPTGTDCDEYPYASTFDGGLGCFPAGYTGTGPLANQGGTRCADPSQNRRHGQQLATFYRNVLGNVNSAPFVSSGPFRFRTTAAVGPCPRRDDITDAISPPLVEPQPHNSSMSVQLTFRNVTTASGQFVLIPYNGEEEKAMLAVGQPVWTPGDDGEGTMEEIITSEDVAPLTEA